MHTSNITDSAGREWTIHHNGDFSGDLRLMVDEELIEHWPNARPNAYYVAMIPYEVIKELVGRQMLSEHIR